MNQAKLVLGAAVLSALALPALPAQQRNRIGEELRQELREIIRTEVRAAVKEALQQAHAGHEEGGGEHDVPRFEFDFDRAGIRDVVRRALQRRGEPGRPMVFEIDANRERGEHEEHGHEGEHAHEAIEEVHEGGQHGHRDVHVFRWDPKPIELRWNQEPVVLHWNQEPGEHGRVRTFSFPGGEAKVHIERSDEKGDDKGDEAGHGESELHDVRFFGPAKGARGLHPITVERNADGKTYFFSLGERSEKKAKEPAKAKPKSEKKPKTEKRINLIRV